MENGKEEEKKEKERKIAAKVIALKVHNKGLNTLLSDFSGNSVTALQIEDCLEQMNILITELIEIQK